MPHLTTKQTVDGDALGKQPREPKQVDEVDTPSVAYDRMAEKWILIHDLLGGTLKMRARATRWLPQEPAEETHNYQIRLGRSILFEAYSDTVDKLASDPFSQTVAIKDTPEQLKVLEEDTDRTGKSLTSLGRELFEDGVNYGKCHILVYFTRIPENEDPEGERATVADERDRGARPVFIRIPPPNLIGWKTADDSNGQPQLIEIRFKEIKIESTGEFTDQEVEFIKIFRAEDWEVWRKDPETDKWEKKDDGTHTFGAVPFITIYFKRTGFMTSDPPMEKLAWLNLAHWQSDSDQRNILRFSRFGILFAKGLTRDEAERGLTVGPTNMFTSASKDAEMKYVEHTGQAIAAGERDLETLERRMEIVGAQPMVRVTVRTTATERQIGERRNLTIMQAWIRELESGLRDAFQFAGQWISVSLPDEFSIDVYSDFEITFFDNKDLDFLLKSVVAGKLSDETYIDEVKRRGKISQSIDAKEERERIAQQMIGGPAGGLNAPDDGGDSIPSGFAITDEAGTDDHRHVIEPNATETDVGGEDPHTHPILEDGSLGEVNDHTHEIQE